MVSHRWKLGFHFSAASIPLYRVGKIGHSHFDVTHGKNSLVYFDEKGEDELFSGLILSK